MARHKDITGKRHGRLTAISFVDINPSNKSAIWLCRCDCGNTTHVQARLLGGETGTKSCGCIKIEKNKTIKRNSAGINKTHGESRADSGKRSPEYVVWLSMRQRCNDEKHANYHLYGAKGIHVCHEWNSSFEQFLLDMGRRPSPKHSIDRIDPLKEYSPENCRWATATEQANNRTSNSIVLYEGKELTASQAANLLSVPERTVHHWARNVGQRGDISAKFAKWRSSRPSLKN